MNGSSCLRTVISDKLCRLTLRHDVTGMPGMERMIQGGESKLIEGGGGWPWILSDLKTLLETGAANAL